MTAEPWRFIDSGPLPGADNMALDEAMLEAHAAGRTPPTLRVYTWRPPALSLGRFQSVESSIDTDACRERGIDIVRRPTGGRAILHTRDEVTFSLVVSTRTLGTAGVMNCYRVLARGILAGLRLLGLDASLVERAPHPRPETADPACFAVRARCDFVVGSAKLVGSAQVRRAGIVLQQNSLPLAIHLQDWDQVFRRPPSAPTAVGLWDAAGRRVGCGEVAEALRDGFSRALGVAFEECALTDGETARARDLAPKAALLTRQRFSSPFSSTT